MHATVSVGQVYSMLTQLDENSDGVINVAHLKRALAEIVVPAASADDVAATVDFVNVNGERFVDLHEVVRTRRPLQSSRGGTGSACVAQKRPITGRLHRSTPTNTRRGARGKTERARRGNAAAPRGPRVRVRA